MRKWRTESATYSRMRVCECVAISNNAKQIVFFLLLVFSGFAKIFARCCCRFFSCFPIVQWKLLYRAVFRTILLARSVVGCRRHAVAFPNKNYIEFIHFTWFFDRSAFRQEPKVFQGHFIYCQLATFQKIKECLQSTGNQRAIFYNK